MRARSTLSIILLSSLLLFAGLTEAREYTGNARTSDQPSTWKPLVSSKEGLLFESGTDTKQRSSPRYYKPAITKPGAPAINLTSLRRLEISPKQKAYKSSGPLIDRVKSGTIHPLTRPGLSTNRYTNRFGYISMYRRATPPQDGFE